MFRLIAKLLDWMLYPLLILLGKNLPKCERCKGKMEKRDNPRLFLIPVHSDHDYEASKEYYIKNCYAISSEAEIPTGQRACRFWELSCIECGARRILVEDFLKVRDTEVIEKCQVYDGDSFNGLI
jgi:hypothetical protein